MSDPRHPTRPDWEMEDPEINPPPRGGEQLLLINKGGALIVGPWSDDCWAYSRKPRIPDSVKQRMTASRLKKIAEEAARMGSHDPV